MLNKIKTTIANLVRKPGNLRQRLCAHEFGEPSYGKHSEWFEDEAKHPLTGEPIGKVHRRTYTATHKCGKCGYVQHSQGYDTKPFEVPSRFRNERLK